MFDIVFSFIGIVILFPFFIVISLIIAMTSKGGVFYYQQRVGKEGRPFSCIKFRTMYAGCEKQGTITTVSDNRITQFGKILRRYKVDELAQLFNVLLGTMSFVGPRPDVKGYADRLSGCERMVLSVRPGITGPATFFFRFEEQILSKVSDVNLFNDAVIWPIKIKLNMNYVRSMNIWNDFGFIAITIMPALNKLLHMCPDSPKTPEQLYAYKNNKD